MRNGHNIMRRNLKQCLCKYWPRLMGKGYPNLKVKRKGGRTLKEYEHAGEIR